MHSYIIPQTAFSEHFLSKQLHDHLIARLKKNGYLTWLTRQLVLKLHYCIQRSTWQPKAKSAIMPDMAVVVRLRACSLESLLQNVTFQNYSINLPRMCQSKSAGGSRSLFEFFRDNIIFGSSLFYFCKYPYFPPFVLRRTKCSLRFSERPPSAGSLLSLHMAWLQCDLYPYRTIE